MNLKPFLLLCLTFAAFGCVSTPKQYLTQTPIAIKAEQLSQYWQVSQQSSHFNINANLKMTSTKGEVQIRYLIDSNGNVFEPTIVKSTPVGVFDKAGLKAFAKMHFVKANENPKAIPVYYTMTINFE